jgi:hypothetical protein
MNEPVHRPWLLPVVLFGIGYALVGILFALPTTHAQPWRLAAWAVSALGFGAHIAYERLQLRNTARSAALHVALAAALGAFGLAVSANVHALSTASGNQHRLLLALGIWPVITALPAFFVALGAVAILGAFSSRQGK